MALTIKAHKGFDHRDEPADIRGCRGMQLSFTALGEHRDIQYAMTLEMSTYWMSRPLRGERVRSGGPQDRRHLPGTDGEMRRDPSVRVNLCVHPGPTVPDYFLDGGGECPWLGGQCVGTSGYMVGDDAFRVLLDDGEDALEAWLHDTAANWLKIEEATP